jgi:hypothetical protein
MIWYIKMEYKYSEICFDSADCTTAKSPNYSITDWPNFTLPDQHDNIIAMKILEAQIPFTYYNINSTNNRVKVYEVGSDFNIDITPGNYSGNQLAGEIATQLNNESPSYTYMVSYITTSGKFSINNGSASSFSIEVFSSELLKILGFTSTITTSTGNPQTITSTNIALLRPSMYFYINSLALSPLTQLLLPSNAIINSSSSSTGPQICRVPISSDTVFGENINWSDPAPDLWFNVPGASLPKNIDFYITAGPNDITKPLILNGGSFSIKLGILQPKDELVEVISKTQDYYQNQNYENIFDREPYCDEIMEDEEPEYECYEEVIEEETGDVVAQNPLGSEQKLQQQKDESLQEDIEATKFMEEQDALAAQGKSNYYS